MKRRSVLIGAGGALLTAAAAAVAWRGSVGSQADYEAYARALRAQVGVPALRDLIRHATLAANSHNTQPWRFRPGDGAIELLPDFSRRTPAVDPDDHHLFVSLGCAAENLLVAGTAAGWTGELQSAPGDGVRYLFSKGKPRPDPLFAAIGRRQSTRAEYDGRAVPATDLDTLQRAAAMPGVRLVLLTARTQIDRVRDLVVAGNQAQMADPAFMRELKAWLRFNPQQAMASGDGLFAAASGNPSLPSALGGIAFERLFTAAAENDRYARQIDSSPGVAVFIAEHEDRSHWIAVGRACQRFALAATRLGLKHAFINQPVEVAGLRPQLAELVGEKGRRPDIVMRFGHGPQLPFSPRRPLEAVLI